MAKSTLSKPAKQPTVSKQQMTEQDKKDQSSFIKWMVGITLVLILALYYVFSMAIG
jgi:hypothetical protein